MIHPRFYPPFYRNQYNFCHNLHSHNSETVNKLIDDNISPNPGISSALSSFFTEDDFLILLLILFLLLEHSDDYPLLISLVLLFLD